MHFKSDLNNLEHSIYEQQNEELKSRSSSSLEMYNQIHEMLEENNRQRNKIGNLSYKPRLAS